MCRRRKQAGLPIDRCVGEHVLTARLLIERCERLSLDHARGYIDLGTFFESVPFATQWKVERAAGVSAHAIRTVQDLRVGGGDLPPACGVFETARGLTASVCRGRGLGQGDVLSPARAKLVMGVVQRALARMLPGVSFDTVEPGAPFLVYADDGMLLADSPNTLQHAYDAIWMTAAALGLDITVKGKKKTAWAGVWYQGGIPKDCDGWEMRLPDGKGATMGRELWYRNSRRVTSIST